MGGWVSSRKGILAAGLVALVAIPLGVAEYWRHRAKPEPTPIVFRKEPLAVPSYEPIQYNGHDSATPAQKAQFSKIRDFALAAMERRHVSAERTNQFLWQMHFFVPVHYKPISCTKIDYNSQTTKRDVVAMIAAMDEVYKKFVIEKNMPDDEIEVKDRIHQHNDSAHAYFLAVGVHIKDAWVSNSELDYNDRLDVYSFHLEKFIEHLQIYNFYGPKSVLIMPETPDDIREFDQRTNVIWPSYLAYACQIGYLNGKNSGFDLNDKMTHGYFYKYGDGSTHDF